MSSGSWRVEMAKWIEGSQKAEMEAEAEAAEAEAASSMFKTDDDELPDPAQITSNYHSRPKKWKKMTLFNLFDGKEQPRQ
jgi:hypothetical protein